MDNVNFLENVLHSVDSPDIIVFGFQELIDLENRSLTASEYIGHLFSGIRSSTLAFRDCLVGRPKEENRRYTFGEGVEIISHVA
jgi:hypothetical protein